MYVQGRTFTNPTPDPGDQFGLVLANVNGSIIIGAPLDDALAVNAGVAYLFNISTGERLLTFPNPHPGPEPGDQFGRAVAAVGRNVLIGAAFDDTEAADSGAAYLYEGTTGQLLLELWDPTPSFNDGFGRSVASLGNNMLVGAYQKQVGAAVDAGKAYLLNGTTGSLIRTFQKPTPVSGDNFGRSVYPIGNNVLVGAPGDDTGGVDAGAVYLFDGNTGQPLRVFRNPTPAFEDEFGNEIAATGNTVIVGAHQDDLGAMNAGVVHLFDLNTGDLIRTIPNPTPAAGDKFGRSMTVVGSNQVLVGAPFDGFGALEAGSAYLFDIATGQLLQSFHNPSPASRDRFGWSVLGIGDGIAIGAPYRDSGAVDSGVLYLFQTDPQPQPQPPGSDPPPPIFGLPPLIIYVIIATLTIEGVVVFAIFWKRKKQKTLPPPIQSPL